MIPAKILGNPIEVFPFDCADARAEPLKSRRYRLQQPENLLIGLSVSTLGQQLFRVFQRLLSEILGLFVQRRRVRRDGHCGLRISCDKVRRLYLVSCRVFGQHAVYPRDIGNRKIAGTPERLTSVVERFNEQKCVFGRLPHISIEISFCPAFV